MEKKEVAALLNELHEIYGNKMNTEDPKERFDTYCKHLLNVDAELVHKNLARYVDHADNDWPPTIRDLRNKGPQEVKSTIPNFEETKAYLDSLQRKPLTEEEKEIISAEKEKIKKILGIDE